jgi:hypothetical protein
LDSNNKKEEEMMTDRGLHWCGFEYMGQWKEVHTEQTRIRGYVYQSDYFRAEAQQKRRRGY